MIERQIVNCDILKIIQTINIEFSLQNKIVRACRNESKVLYIKRYEC